MNKNNSNENLEETHADDTTTNQEEDGITNGGKMIHIFEFDKASFSAKQALKYSQFYYKIDRSNSMIMKKKKVL